MKKSKCAPTILSFVTLAFVSTFWLVPIVAAAVFGDGFEGPTLTSFWTPSGPGTAALTSTIAHGGHQSVLLSTSTTNPYNATLAHVYGAEQSGSVSIYVYNQLCCNASADLQIIRQNGDWANIQQLANGNFQARVSINGSQNSRLVVKERPTSWHLFEIDSDANGVDIKLDGVSVLSDPGIRSFQSVALNVWGSPSVTRAAYDDFSAVTSAVISDGYEAPTISSFWRQTGPGRVAISSAAAHSGFTSVQLTTSSTYPWNASLEHNFGVDQAGYVGIWVHSGLCCGASADLSITKANGDWANIQQLDTGGFQTRVSVNGVQTGKFVSGSSAAWHLFEIQTGPSGVTVKLDGTAVLTDPSITSLQFVSINVWGSPSGATAYYDDFVAEF